LIPVYIKKLFANKFKTEENNNEQNNNNNKEFELKEKGN
jgi:hypothetical protein